MLRNRLSSAGLTFVLLASALVPVVAAAVARPALIVLNKSDNELVVVDLKTNKITGRVPVGMGPHEVVTTPDGATAFVANYGDGPNPGSSISVVDLNTLKELRRVDTKPMFRPHGLAFAAFRLLRQVPDVRRRRVQRDAALLGGNEAREGPQQRRLAGAVDADQPDDVTGGDHEVEIGEQDAVTVAGGEVLRDERGHEHSRNVKKGPRSCGGLSTKGE